MDAGIVSRDSNGSYSLTTFGNTIMTQIPSINFLSKNRNYFSDYYFANLPMKFVQRIGSLDNSNFIRGLVAVIEEIKELVQALSKLHLWHDPTSAFRSNGSNCEDGNGTQNQV